MSYTAIVLTDASRASLLALAASQQMLPEGWIIRAHHVTLAMGKLEGVINDLRTIHATHIGYSATVVAVQVAGASDSKNKRPHVTIAHAQGATPKEANDIVVWFPIESIHLTGFIKFCE